MRLRKKKRMVHRKSHAHQHRNLLPPTDTVVPLHNSTGNWSRSDMDRARAFADHFRNVFQPNSATYSFILAPITVSDLAPQDPIEFRPS